MNRLTNRIKIQTRMTINKGRPDFVPFLGVFCLLLLFVVPGSLFVEFSGIPVSVPEVNVQNRLGARKIVVTVSRDGKFFLNDSEAPDIAKLKESLLEMTKSGDEKDRSTIILRADKRVDYGLIARVLSLAESLNLNVFLLTAAPAERKDTGRRLEEE